MKTDRTFAVFTTPAFEAGEVYDETFQQHARAILEPLREKLIASGQKVSALEDHSFYGVKFSVDDAASGRVRVLLQVVGPWLLMLTRELKFFERIRGEKENEVDDAIVSAVDRALTDSGIGPRRWFTEVGYEAAANEEGPIKL